jgi:S-(hydroxymethyl)glutathione dehydrogenase/alcohol dehydrogenase
LGAIVDNEININSNERVAVIGCGGVGLNLIQALSLKDVSIIGIDRESTKANLSISLGATYFDEELNDKVDLIIDTTGNVSLIAKNFNQCDRMVLVGQPVPGQELCIPNALQFFDGKGKSIKATQGGKFNPSVDIPRYLKLEDKINLDVVTNRFSLNEINKAFDLLRTGTEGRIMIGMEND